MTGFISRETQPRPQGFSLKKLREKPWGRGCVKPGDAVAKCRLFSQGTEEAGNIHS